VQAVLRAAGHAARHLFGGPRVRRSFSDFFSISRVFRDGTDPSCAPTGDSGRRRAARCARDRAGDRARIFGSPNARHALRLGRVGQIFFPSPAASTDITLFFLRLPLDGPKKPLLG